MSEQHPGPTLGELYTVYLVQELAQLRQQLATVQAERDQTAEQWNQVCAERDQVTHERDAARERFGEAIRLLVAAQTENTNLQAQERRLREALEDVRLDCFQKCEYVRCDHRIQDTVEEAVGPDALDNAAKRAATWSNMEDELIRLQKAERWLQVLMAYRADAEVGQVEAAMALGVKWNEVDTLADDAELQGYRIVEEALAGKEGK